MVEISRYRSRFSADGREFAPFNDRFVAYVESEPALMLELTANVIQFYGPRALSVGRFLGNIQLIMEVSYFGSRPNAVPFFLFPDRGSLFSDATLTCCDLGGQTSVWSLDKPWLQEPSFGQRFADFRPAERFIGSLVPDEPTYLKATIPMIGATHWADIEGTQNPRSGFVFHPSIFGPRRFGTNIEPIFTLFRSLTAIKLAQEDIVQIIDFMLGDQRERNV